MLHRRVIALFAAVAAAAVAGVGMVVPAQAATTAVPDAAFAACLNTNYLGQAATDPITVAQLQGLTDQVYCSGEGIVSLEGAQDLTGITDLVLDSEKISDLTPLSGLTNLTSLQLSNSPISDLTPLAGLTNLGSLILSGDQITDLTPLAGLSGVMAWLAQWLWSPMGSQSVLLPATVGQAVPLPVVSIPAVGSLTLSVASGPATLSGNTVTLTSAGTATVNWASPTNGLDPIFSGTLTITSLTAADNVVPDPAFQACLNYYLGLPTPLPAFPVTGQAAATPITAAQLETLTGATIFAFGVDGLACGNITSLEGAQYLTGISYLDVDGSELSDLSPLAGLSSLTSLSITNAQVSDLAPLANLSQLASLQLDDNQVSDLAPLANLSQLAFLRLDDNQVSDVTPLAGLSSLTSLSLYGNQVSSLAPLGSLTGLTNVQLGSNHITDLSPLSGLPDTAWIGSCGKMLGSGYCGGPRDQTASMTVTTGVATALPVVSVPAFGDVTWTVASGAATVTSDGSVTMANPGTATLTWTDANGYFTGTLTVTAVAPVLVSSVAVSPVSAAVLVGATTTVMATVAPSNAANLAVTWSSSDTSIATVDSNGVVTGVKAGTVTVTATAADGSGKFGTATVTVSMPAPVPSVPGSTVVKSGLKASTTGGAARLANGKDAFTATVSVVDTDGNPMTGVAGRLAVTAPAGVTISGITDNGDGTYSFTAVSAKPGNYKLTVTLDGTSVGSPIPVNFIGATDPPTQQVGATQTATGLGFLPGEKVTVTVHSTPLALGTFTADSAGMVQVSFPVPAGFADASHTVVFAGVTSGTVSASFAVPAQTLVPAGGTPVPGSPAAGFAFASFLTLAGGVLVRRLRTSR